MDEMELITELEAALKSKYPEFGWSVISAYQEELPGVRSDSSDSSDSGLITVSINVEFKIDSRIVTVPITWALNAITGAVLSGIMQKALDALVGMFTRGDSVPDD